MRLTPGIRFSRRRLLHVGFLGGVGLSLADYFRLAAASESSGGQKPTADAVIFVHLAGGPAHLDTLDMKPDAPAEERGPFGMIDTRIAGLKAVSTCRLWPGRSIGSRCSAASVTRSAITCSPTSFCSPAIDRAPRCGFRRWVRC
jgi:hypothetical protein